jgi:CheY-like chemotaxis protein
LIGFRSLWLGLFKFRRFLPIECFGVLQKGEAMRTVLLVEDSKLLRTDREHILQRAGYRVITAVDGVQAVIQAYDNHPDLILLDLMLPKLDGASVLRTLKADPATAKIPVIVVTALSEKNQSKLMEAGAAAFLEKGLLLKSDEPLLYTIKKVLES